MRALTSGLLTILNSKNFIGTNTPRVVVLVDDNYMYNVSNFDISREDNAYAQTCTIILNNINPTDPTDTGYYNQVRDNGAYNKPPNEWNNVIQPGKSIEVMYGYGSSVFTAFNGTIDTVRTRISGSEAILEINGRDAGRLLVDGTISSIDKIDAYEYLYIDYPISGVEEVYLEESDTNPYLHEIFIDACRRAGFTLGSILYDEFTMRLDDLDNEYFEELTGTWDIVVQQVAKLLNAKVYVDEDNNINLRDQWAEDSYFYDSTITLTSTNWSSLDIGSNYVDRAIRASIILGGGSYAEGTDWEYNESTNSIRRLTGSSIPSGSVITIEYSYVNYIFKNGVSIFSIDQVVSHDDTYATLIATNNDYDLQRQLSLGTLGDLSSPNPVKKYVEDLPELFTNELLDAWLVKKKLNMKREYWGVECETILVPTLQINDIVQFLVYGTIQGMYRIRGFKVSYDGSGYSVSIVATFIRNAVQDNVYFYTSDNEYFIDSADVYITVSTS